MPKSLMAILLVLATAAASAAQEKPPAPGPLDPRGTTHIPIGIANTVDTLKTFVEPEGCFSPGVATYGIYFWLWHNQKLTAPTMSGVPCEHGLSTEGYLIPWSAWQAGDIAVRSEICQVKRSTRAGDVLVVAARVELANKSDHPSKGALCVALRGIGPAGGPVHDIALSANSRAILAERHPALISAQPVSAAGVWPEDHLVDIAGKGQVPQSDEAWSRDGTCCGLLRIDFDLAPGAKKTLGFICPVLPGRRAVGHNWDGKSPWAQLDDATPNPPTGGLLQPDPGLAFYQSLKPDDLFAEAAAYWRSLAGRVSIRLPDPRWAQCFAAITGHLAMCMNENAPDVSVVNYNVFNRDGMYTANVFQKSGRFDLSEAAINYFLSHPFNGRIHPEADNPGQILWIIGEHWRFTHDKAWLSRVYPSVRKLAAMIRYYRTTPGKHYVALDSLDFGDAVPAEKRRELIPGSCDGRHPEYTEAYDISGLRQAAMLAQAIGNATEAADYRQFADTLFQQYDDQFGARLAKDYGSYSVLWPCRLYSFDEGKAHEQFRSVGAQKPAGWRYFPLATAHQGLLAGNRAAGHATIDQHLDHDQMRNWYAFDEGGKSGAGGWRYIRTTWNGDVAMPHGWAIAEVYHLLRDSIAFEDNDRLILLGGLKDEWFTDPVGMSIENFPTHFGPLSLHYTVEPTSATLTLAGANPPQGFALRLPTSLKATVTINDKPAPQNANGDWLIPVEAKTARIVFGR